MPGLKVVVESPPDLTQEIVLEIDKSGLVYCEDCATIQRLQSGVKLVDYKQFSLNKALTEYMATDVPSPVTS